MEGGTGQQMKNCLTPCPPDSLGCPAAEDAQYENDAISNLNQETSFLPLLPPALHFKPRHSTWHRTSGRLLECHAACQDPIPWGPQWLAAIITLKRRAIISGFEPKWPSPGNSPSPHLHSHCSSSVEWRSLKKKRCLGQSYLQPLKQPSLFLNITHAPHLCRWQFYPMYQPLISTVHICLMVPDCCSYTSLQPEQHLQNAVCRGEYF